MRTLFLLITTFCSINLMAQSDFFNVSEYVPEVSGATFDKYQNAIWSVGDSGERVLGRTNLDTKETKVFPIIGHDIATDREELVEDGSGNIWILSVGDNDSVRTDIEINMVSPLEVVHSNTLTVQRTIKIKYPDGPKDVEGAFYFDEKIYLIEKTLSNIAKIYTIDISKDASNNQVVKFYASINSFKTRLITAACIDENEEVFLLTYYGTFKLKEWKNTKTIKTKMINVSPFISQKETLVCFKDKLLIANESGSFWIENKK